MKEEIIRLRNEGKSYSQIQKELGCAQSTISYHCSLLGKENAKARSKKQKRVKCQCGNFKMKSSILCKRCSTEGIRKKKREKIYESSIEEYYKDYTTNTKHTSIRRLARVFMQETKTEKICKICGFSDYVELCHIKAIKDFDKKNTIGEVNSLDNLVYLCPNHHKLLDIGKLKL